MKTRNLTYLFIAATIVMLSVLTSCRKDINGPVPATTPPTPTKAQTTPVPNIDTAHMNLRPSHPYVLPKLHRAIAPAAARDTAHM